MYDVWFVRLVAFSTVIDMMEFFYFYFLIVIVEAPMIWWIPVIRGDFIIGEGWRPVWFIWWEFFLAIRNDRNCGSSHGMMDSGSPWRFIIAEGWHPCSWHDGRYFRPFVNEFNYGLFDRNCGSSECMMDSGNPWRFYNCGRVTSVRLIWWEFFLTIRKWIQLWFFDHNCGSSHGVMDSGIREGSIFVSLELLHHELCLRITHPLQVCPMCFHRLKLIWQFKDENIKNLALIKMRFLFSQRKYYESGY